MGNNDCWSISHPRYSMASILLSWECFQKAAKWLLQFSFHLQNSDFQIFMKFCVWFHFAGLLCVNCCELFNLRWFQCRSIVVIIGIWLLGHCQKIRLKAVTEGSRGRGSSSKKFQIFRCQRFWAFRRSLTNCRSRTRGPAITHCPRPVTCPCFMVRRRSSLLAPSPWWPLSSSFDHLPPS